VALDIAPLDLMLDDEMRVAVYRIVSEALHNSRNHAEGKGMAVQASDMGGLVRIVISDKGPGFAAGAHLKAEPLSSMAHVSLGLAGMRNRARSVGADLTVNSRPGRGTEIVLLLDRARMETRQGRAVDAAEDGAAEPQGGAVLGAEI
jgi:signal transduction histidine kinase